MKRFLSLILVAIMLLSTFMLASCDLFDQAKDFVHGVFGIEDGEQSGVRTTITLEEWVALNDVTNYTYKMYSPEMEMAVWATDKAIKVYYCYKYDGLQTEYTMIYDLPNNNMLVESFVGWFGYQTEEIMGETDYSLKNFVTFNQEVFDQMVYDEDEKCYDFDIGGAILKFYFEDGVLVRTHLASDDLLNTVIEIGNIGTTVVEVPEYTIINDGKIDPSKADPSVRTTITEEDLINFFSNPNFTVSTAINEEFDVIGGDTVELTLKVAENSLELTASQFGESESQYMTIVDGILYSIERYGSGHLATPIGDIESILGQLGSIEDISIFDYLVYDEVGRYYVLDIEGVKFYLFFEEGKLVKAIYMMDSYVGTTLEITFAVTDIGTTAVELPEYIINAE